MFPAFTSTSIDELEAKKYGLSNNEKKIIFKIYIKCTSDIMKRRPKNVTIIS